VRAKEDGTGLYADARKGGEKKLFAGKPASERLKANIEDEKNLEW